MSSCRPLPSTRKPEAIQRATWAALRTLTNIDGSYEDRLRAAWSKGLRLLHGSKSKLLLDGTREALEDCYRFVFGPSGASVPIETRERIYDELSALLVGVSMEADGTRPD